MNNIEAFYPLSPLQQGMLFETLKSPESEAYFEQLIYTLHGGFNVSAFDQAWQRVLDRHPSLRTTFMWEGMKEPIQLVHQKVELRAETFDWRDLSPGEQEQRLQEYIQADRSRGFDLSLSPLMRLAVIRVADDVNHIIWSHHHILFDGWSMPIVWQEVFAFYESLVRGMELRLEASRPYRDYIVWLRQQDLSQAETFWRETLSGFISPTPLGADRPLKGAEGFDEQQILLSAEMTSALQSLARQHQLTINTLVQGVFALLLARYSGEDDVVFGATVSGRPAELIGIESMVGVFINTLPVRAQIPADEFLLAWLKTLQAKQIQARQFEYSPLFEIQRWSEVPREAPLFEGLLVLENYPTGPLGERSGTELEVRDFRVFEHANYPLTVIAGLAGGLMFRFLYDRSRFDAATITRMSTHIESLLKAVVDNPHQRLSELPLLSEAERSQVLVEWNDTQAEYPQDQCIHQVFEAIAEKTPDAAAIVSQDERLSYAELNRRANQLAHHLIALGVATESRVGLSIDRSLDMVIAVLAIVKAGGAYLPLDPSYPLDRLLFMIDDAQIDIIISHRRHLDKLSASPCRILSLDDLAEPLSSLCSLNPRSRAVSDNLAYISYTSGSTGRPKGVEVPHRAIVRLVIGANYARLDHRTCLLHLSPLSFDASSFEIWGALLVGGRCVLYPPQMPTAEGA